VFRTAGAGGWGDPLERPPAEVAADVRRELISLEAAERDYGVVIRDDMVDEQATANLPEAVGVR
jgi:N-methylhydantoinase B